MSEVVERLGTRVMMIPAKAATDDVPPIQAPSRQPWLEPLNASPQPWPDEMEGYWFEEPDGTIAFWVERWFPVRLPEQSAFKEQAGPLVVRGEPGEQDRT